MESRRAPIAETIVGMWQNCHKIMEDLAQYPLTQELDKLERGQFLQAMNRRMNALEFETTPIELLNVLELAEIHLALFNTRESYAKMAMQSIANHDVIWGVTIIGTKRYSKQEVLSQLYLS